MSNFARDTTAAVSPTARARARQAALVGLVSALVPLAGCQQQMADQPSYKSFDPSEFFADGRSARLPVAGTVARGHLRTDRELFTGRISGRSGIAAKSLPAGDEQPPTPTNTGVKQEPVADKPNSATEPSAMSLVEREIEQNRDFIDYIPLAVTKETVEHGYHRYMIYCVVCHDPLGTGQGKVVERGYTRPPSYHIDRLRQAPIGRLFAVMSEGYGSMPSYADQIPAADRWAIAAYVRALQLSQHFPSASVPAEMEQQWTQPGRQAP